MKSLEQAKKIFAGRGATLITVDSITSLDNKKTVIKNKQPAANPLDFFIQPNVSKLQ